MTKHKPIYKFKRPMNLLMKFLFWTAYQPDAEIPVDSGAVRSLFLFSKPCQMCWHMGANIMKADSQGGFYEPLTTYNVRYTNHYYTAATIF